MAESNNEELVLFPSYKRRKLALHYEAATSMENLSISTDSNQLLGSCETILLAESNFDYNEEAIIEHEIPLSLSILSSTSQRVSVMVSRRY